MKRAAERQLTKDDDPEAEECNDSQPSLSQQDGFQKAPREVIANRRILKGRRSLKTSSAAGRPSPFTSLVGDTSIDVKLVNPFASLGKASTEEKVNHIVNAGAEGGEKDQADVKKKRGVGGEDGINEPRTQKDGTQGVEDSEGSAKMRKPQEMDEIKLENSAQSVPSVGETTGAQATENVIGENGEKRRRDNDLQDVASVDSAYQIIHGRVEEIGNQNKGQTQLPAYFVGLSSKEGPVETKTGKVEDPKPGVESVKPKEGIDPEKPSNLVEKPKQSRESPPLFGFGSRPHLTFGVLSQSAPDAKKFAQMAKDAKPIAEEPTVTTNTPQLKQLDKVVTGEEDDETTFKTRARLYGFVKDEKGSRWKEEGLGILKINVNKVSKKSRILMRANGTLRLLLNSPIWEKMKLDRANENSVRIVVLQHDSGSLKTKLLRVPKEKDLDELIKIIDAVKK